MVMQSCDPSFATFRRGFVEHLAGLSPLSSLSKLRLIFLESCCDGFWASRAMPRCSRQLLQAMLHLRNDRNVLWLVSWIGYEFRRTIGGTVSAARLSSIARKKPIYGWRSLNLLQCRYWKLLVTSDDWSGQLQTLANGSESNVRPSCLASQDLYRVLSTLHLTVQSFLRKTLHINLKDSILA